MVKKNVFFVTTFSIFLFFSPFFALSYNQEIIQQKNKEQPPIVFKITAKGTGHPLSKVEVKIKDALFFSDPTGTVTVLIPSSDEGFVFFSRKGYEKLKLKFSEVRASGVYDIRLIPDVVDDNVIVVKGTRKIHISQKSIDIEEAKKVAPNRDPAQVVKLLPGVQSSNFRSQVVVRGSGPNDSKYYIDDLEVPFIFHNTGNLSVIPGQQMQGVDFESGGFGPEYGDATGGVIKIRTKTDIPEYPMTQIVFNVPFYSGIYHERALSSSEALFSGFRISYVEFILKVILEAYNRQNKKNGSSLNVAPYFSDAQVVYLNNHENGYTKISLLGAYDGIKAIFPLDVSSSASGRESLNISTEFVNLGLEQEQRINKDWKFQTTQQLYYYKSKFSFIDNRDDRRVLAFRMPTEFTYNISKKESLYLGVDPRVRAVQDDFYQILFQPNNPNFDPEDAPRFLGNDQEKDFDVATWASLDYALGSCFIIPGARLSYDQRLKKSILDPRFRMKYEVIDKHTLKGAIGQYSQSPDLRQTSATLGNPHLNWVSSYHYIVGLESKWSDAWDTDVQGFYKEINHAVTADKDTRYSNQKFLKIYGAEFFLRRQRTERLFGWISYTYSKGQERVKDGPWRVAHYDQTHVLSLVGDYKLTGTWDLGSRYSYHTGDTYNLVSDKVYDANLDKYQARSSEADLNAGRIPNYHAFTLYLTHDFLFDASKLSMRFGFESAWYKPQVTNVFYNYDYSKTKDFSFLAFIPFFEMQGEF